VVREDERSQRRLAARRRLRRRRFSVSAGVVAVNSGALAEDEALAEIDLAGLTLGFGLFSGADSRDRSSRASFDSTRATVMRVPGSRANERATSSTASNRAESASFAVAARPLRGATIVLDPGHNGGNAAHPSRIGRLVDAGTPRKPCDTAGTTTATGYTEAAYNWDLSRRLEVLLRRRGARVVLTRSSNRGVGRCIDERAAIGNRVRADAAISIHADGGPSRGRGFHVIYPASLRGLTDDIFASSRRLAVLIRSHFHAGTGMPHATYVGRKGPDVRADLGGLNLSDVPKAFIETGNMQNPLDAALLADPRFRARAARALAAGIARFLALASCSEPRRALELGAREGRRC
jgi:N-acetylmuramoyl-L-alanine amidase